MLKYIFVDFDNTLCLHPERPDEDGYQITSLFDGPEYCAKMRYADSLVNYILLDVLRQYKDDGVTLYLITDTCSLALDAKKYWCEQQCPDLFSDFFGTSSDLSKPSLIKFFMSHHNLNSDEVAFICNNCELTYKLNPFCISRTVAYVMQKGDIE